MSQDQVQLIISSIESIRDDVRRMDGKIDKCASKEDFKELSDGFTEHKAQMARYKAWATGSIATFVLVFSVIKGLPHDVGAAVKTLIQSKGH